MNAARVFASRRSCSWSSATSPSGRSCRRRALGFTVAFGRRGVGHASAAWTRGRISGRPAVTSWEAAKVLGAGLFLIVGYLTSVMVMRRGDIGMVAPFRYTSLIWAIVLGLRVFGDLPDRAGP